MHISFSFAFHEKCFFNRLQSIQPTLSATKNATKTCYCPLFDGNFEQRVLWNALGKPMTAVTRGKKKTLVDLSICEYLGPEAIRGDE